jgi:spore coat polysaccharide biosynthesis protein SpsF
VIDRCRISSGLSNVVVATSVEEQDDVIASIAERAGAPVYRGPLDDARTRLLDCARAFGAEVFVRVTADNPFVEPTLIDSLVAAKETVPDCPYALHDLRKTVYGAATELVDARVLEAWQDRLPSQGREHVTTGLIELDGALCLEPPAAFADPELSLTVDTLDQYVNVWQLMRRFGNGPDALPRIVAAFQSDQGSGLEFKRRG